MKVFVSWSGDRSKQLADSIHWLIKRVLQRSEPWISTQDLSAGLIWPQELFEQLEQSDVGVLCMTLENKNSRWMLFEAGALTIRRTRARVIPFTLDFAASDLDAPLKFLNGVSADQSGTTSLLASLNEALRPNHLERDQLQESVGLWWPQFQERLKAIPPSQVEPPKPLSAEEEMREMRSDMKAIRAVMESYVSKPVIVRTKVTAEQPPLAKYWGPELTNEQTFRVSNMFIERLRSELKGITLHYDLEKLGKDREKLISDMTMDILRRVFDESEPGLFYRKEAKKLIVAHIESVLGPET